LNHRGHQEKDKSLNHKEHKEHKEHKGHKGKDKQIYFCLFSKAAPLFAFLLFSVVTNILLLAFTLSPLW
jgi:hypothetical protein